MTKIDDEMVDRAEAAFIRDFVKRGERFSTMHVRGLLEAALSPKPEPEIEVSEGMIEAGRGGFWAAVDAGKTTDEAYAESYRAMESTRLKEAEITQQWKFGKLSGGAAYAAEPAPQGVNAAAPVKETGGGVVRVTNTKWIGAVKVGDTVRLENKGDFGICRRLGIVTAIEVTPQERRKSNVQRETST